MNCKKVQLVWSITLFACVAVTNLIRVAAEPFTLAILAVFMVAAIASYYDSIPGTVVAGIIAAAIGARAVHLLTVQAFHGDYSIASKLFVLYTAVIPSIVCCWTIMQLPKKTQTATTISEGTMETVLDRNPYRPPKCR